MNHGLLIGTLALMLSTTVQTRGDDANDPYQWLEEVLGEKPLAWVKERNAESVGELRRSEQFRTLDHRILEILDSEARIPAIQKIGPYYYNFWRDAKNPRGLWRRTTLDEYRKAKPNWEIVLDLDALGKEENVNWVWHGAQALKPEYKLALVSLSRGGADASVVREFDLTTKAFVKDGYALPEAKSQVSWRGPRQRVCRDRFRPGLADQVGLSANRQGMETRHAAGRGRGCIRGPARRHERRSLFATSRRASNATSSCADRRSGPARPSCGATASSVKIDKPDDARASFAREWLLVQLRSDWTVGGKTYPAGALLATHLDAFLEGERDFDVLFEPAERKSLVGFSPTRHHILVTELDNVRSRIYVLTHRDGRWHREPLPGVPEFGEVSADDVDADESDDYFLNVTDFLTPTTLALGTRRRGPRDDAQAAPGVLRREWPGRLAARSRLRRRHPRSLLRGRPQGPGS